MDSKEKCNWAFEHDDIENNKSHTVTIPYEVCITENRFLKENIPETIITENVKKKRSTRLFQRPWQIIGIFSGAMVHISTGVMIALTGIILPSLLNPEPGDIQITENEAYIFGSIIHAGSTAGSLISGPLMVWIGQRVSLLIFLPISIISWLVIAFANSYWLLTSSRFVSGLLVGLGTVCSNNFVIEILNPKVKGRGFAILDLFRQSGFLFVYIIGSTSLSWRMVSLISGLISCSIPLILFVFLKDSPRWLATKGKMAEAEQALQFYRGKHTDITSELKTILADDTCSENGVKNQIKLMSTGYILQLMILSLYLSFASHFTGNMAIVMYSATIFASSNTGIDEYYSTIIIGVARVIGTICFWICADRVSRRIVAIIPMILAGVCMAVLGVFFYFKEKGFDVNSIFWLPLVSLIAFSILICTTLPAMMMFRSELIPNRVRSIASSFLFVAFSVGGFISAQTFPYMIKDLGSAWTFWFFACNNAVLAFVVFLYVPETKGKSLEEIEKLFIGGLKLQCSFPCSLRNK